MWRRKQYLKIMIHQETDLLLKASSSTTKYVNPKCRMNHAALTCTQLNYKTIIFWPVFLINRRDNYEKKLDFNSTTVCSPITAAIRNISISDPSHTSIISRIVDRAHNKMPTPGQQTLTQANHPSLYLPVKQEINRYLKVRSFGLEWFQTAPPTHQTPRHKLPVSLSIYIQIQEIGTELSELQKNVVTFQNTTSRPFPVSHTCKVMPVS